MLQLLGFKYMDLGLFERSTGLTPSQLAADPKRFTKRLKPELHFAGLQVSDVFLQTGLEPTIAALNDPSGAVRSRNRKMFMLALDLCSALDCIHLTGLPGVRHRKTREADDRSHDRVYLSRSEPVSAAQGILRSALRDREMMVG
jgi:hypothetical protein